MTIRCRFKPSWLLMGEVCCLWDRRTLLLGLPITSQATLMARGSILRLIRLNRGPQAAASRGPIPRDRRVPLARIRAICIRSSAGANPCASTGNTARTTPSTTDCATPPSIPTTTTATPL